MSGVAQLLRTHGIRSAKKELGQNFLVRSSFVEQMLSQSEPFLCQRQRGWAGTAVVEIGPGTGAITRHLLAKQCLRLLAIDLDPDMLAILKNTLVDPRLVLVQGDAMQMKVDEVTKYLQHASIPVDQRPPLAVVSNLPFHIGTDLLYQWTEQCHDGTGLFSAYRSIAFLLIVQQEVAQRICAAPGEQHRSRLSVLAQSMFDIEQVIAHVQPEMFWPVPKVSAAVIGLRVRAGPPLLRLPYTFANNFLRAGFERPHRKLKANLTAWLQKERRGISSRKIEELCQHWLQQVDRGLVDARATSLSTLQWCALIQAAWRDQETT